ncbi:MAG: DUF692 family protein [Chloroflexia bacterium]|nr:DUF692 family protein [Chloroflexia bacterium]
MPSPSLAVQASAILAKLWSRQEIRPDFLEVTTWMPREEVERFRQLASGQQLLLHGGNLLGAPLTEAQLIELQELLSLVDAPWLSVYISLWPWEVLQEARQRGRQPSALDLGPHLEHFFTRVRGLREELGVSLLLENAPGLPGMEKDPESDPETIAAVLEATGCSFLLDISSAQTAAWNWGYHDPREYLQRLPLDRVSELHLSAPRLTENGHLVDAHDPLREQDYTLLSWLLQRTRPGVVTLEYWRDAQTLLEQVLRLKEELGRP